MAYQVLRDKIQRSDSDIIRYTDDNIDKLVDKYSISYMYPEIYILATQDKSLEHVIKNIERINTKSEANGYASDIMNHQMIMDDVPNNIEIRD